MRYGNLFYYATCVDAPCAREIFGRRSARDRVRTCVRPADAVFDMPLARMVFADRVQIKAARSKALCCRLVFPIPSHDPCAKPF